MGYFFDKLTMRHRRRKHKTLIYLLCLLCGLYIFSKVNVDPRYTFINTDIESECILPDIDPWDRSILKFDWQPDPIVCDSTSTVVFIDDKGKLQFNKSVIYEQNLNEISCEYSNIYRQDDDYVTFSSANKFVNPTEIKSDFLRVKCLDNKKKFKMDKVLLHASSQYEEKNIKPEGQGQYSVFIFGLDSVSRLAGIRKLPLTYKYLTEELEALEFKGHMKTGDNTFPNVVTMLTGKEPFTSELPPSTGVFDSYPFIWKNFSSKSYVTYFGEDSPEMQMFNLGKKGFEKQPTDHYLRPFWRAVKKTSLISTLLDDALIGFEANKINIRKKSSLCYGNTPKHLLAVNYFKDFIRKYTKKRRFGLSWLTDLSHQYVNFLGLGDNDFRDFISWIDKNGHLENSFLFFLSDHGSRIDKIRNTYVGRIEERMPLLLIVPPKNFKLTFPAAFRNLRYNTQKLTSHYDIYRTLIDILNLDFGHPNRRNVKGLSLFSEIPKHRSCFHAGIPENYCSCYSSKNIPLGTPMVQKMSNYVVEQINLILKPDEDKCALLEISKVKQAQEISLGLKHTGEVEFFSIWKYFMEPENEKEQRFLLLLQTQPGNGLVEATIRKDNKGNFSLIGIPSRTNQYGNQSACITDHIRRLFCYCHHI